MKYMKYIRAYHVVLLVYSAIIVGLSIWTAFLPEDSKIIQFFNSGVVGQGFMIALYASLIVVALFINHIIGEIINDYKADNEEVTSE